MQYEKNGVDLSIDFMNLGRLQTAETAIDRYLKAHTLPPKDSTASDSLLHQCREIFVLIDDVYGADAHLQIFGDEINCSDVFSVYEAVVGGVAEVRIQLEQSQLSQARAQKERRARSEAIEAELAQLNEENLAALAADTARLDTALEAARIEQAKRMVPSHDTSVPFSDMSARPLVPLATPPSHTITDVPPHLHQV